MLEVIGAGFGRTGTHSLGFALEKLGFGPCYNMHEVAKNQGHRELWNKALDGEHVDWDHMFSSYKSTVEWPGVTFFDEIVQHYPDARVILTWRDPEDWYGSAQNTIFEALELSVQNPDPDKRESHSLTRRLILEHTFGGRYSEKEYVIEVYQKHIQHVVELVPRERLLQFDIRDGWKPLCDFLQTAIPAEPFPKVNERSEFIDSAPEWVKKIREARK
ncbi:MAG: sulfotransferase family protein [Bacteroidota bacterium]